MLGAALVPLLAGAALLLAPAAASAHPGETARTAITRADVSKPCPGDPIRADHVVRGSFPRSVQGAYVMAPFEVPGRDHRGAGEVLLRQAREPAPNAPVSARATRSTSASMSPDARGDGIYEAGPSSAGGAARAIPTSRSPPRASRPSREKPTRQTRRPTRRARRRAASCPGRSRPAAGRPSSASRRSSEQRPRRRGRARRLSRGDRLLPRQANFADEPYTPAAYDGRPARSRRGLVRRRHARPRRALGAGRRDDGRGVRATRSAAPRWRGPGLHHALGLRRRGPVGGDRPLPAAHQGQADRPQRRGDHLSRARRTRTSTRRTSTTAPGRCSSASRRRRAVRAAPAGRRHLDVIHSARAASRRSTTRRSSRPRSRSSSSSCRGCPWDYTARGDQLRRRRRHRGRDRAGGRTAWAATEGGAQPVRADGDRLLRERPASGCPSPRSPSQRLPQRRPRRTTSRSRRSARARPRCYADELSEDGIQPRRPGRPHLREAVRRQGPDIRLEARAGRRRPADARRSWATTSTPPAT